MLLSQLQIETSPPVPFAPQQKHAPRKNFYKSRASVRSFYPQLCDASGKIAVANDNPASGATVGRYISSDPIGLAGGLNTFGYVGQNPVMRIDPEGEQGGTLVPPGMQQAILLGMGCLQSGSSPEGCYPPSPKPLISLPSLDELVNPETQQCLIDTSAFCKGAVLGCPTNYKLIVGGICGAGTTVGCLLYYERPKSTPKIQYQYSIEVIE